MIGGELFKVEYYSVWDFFWTQLVEILVFPSPTASVLTYFGVFLHYFEAYSPYSSKPQGKIPIPRSCRFICNYVAVGSPLPIRSL